MSEQKEQLPFHEAIIVAVNGASSVEGLETCANLLICTKVPAGHQEIIDALRQKATELNGGKVRNLQKAIGLLKKGAAKKEEQGDKKFFPEYLNQGSKGPAVAALQLLLLDRDLNRNIIVDGDYGEETAKGVRGLQKDLGVDVDGHFGPATREALVEDGGVDVNVIPASAFSGKTKAVAP